MKTHRVLLFFVVSIASLTLLSLLFPRDGIVIAGLRLNFPSPHKVLTAGERKPKKKVDKPRIDPAELQCINDSIDYYRSLLFDGDDRLWLPDGRPDFLDSFFEKADRAKSDKQTLRVLYYGDSQIEMDRITCLLRQRLQSLFGGSGVGLLPYSSSVPSLTTKQENTGKVEARSTFGPASTRDASGMYGPMLRSWLVGSQSTVNYSVLKNKRLNDDLNSFSTVSVLFDAASDMDVDISNGRGEHRSFHAADGGLNLFKVSFDTLSRKAKLSFGKQARVYGVMLDADGGVAVDNIAMRGSSGNKFTDVDYALLSDSYRYLNVGMIVLQFGGNTVPYINDESAVDRYCTQLVKQIELIKRACPGVTVVFVGPSDMSKRIDGDYVTYPVLPYLVKRLREMANDNGVAFWSIFDAMGGEGSMVEWVREGDASSDYVHFSVNGSMKIGQRLSDIIELHYRLYLLRKKISL